MAPVVDRTVDLPSAAHREAHPWFGNERGIAARSSRLCDVALDRIGDERCRISRRLDESHRLDLDLERTHLDHPTDRAALLLHDEASAHGSVDPWKDRPVDAQSEGVVDLALLVEIEGAVDPPLQRREDRHRLLGSRHGRGFARHLDPPRVTADRGDGRGDGEQADRRDAPATPSPLQRDRREDSTDRTDQDRQQRDGAHLRWRRCGRRRERRSLRLVRRRRVPDELRLLLREIDQRPLAGRQQLDGDDERRRFLEEAQDVGRKVPPAKRHFLRERVRRIVEGERDLAQSAHARVRKEGQQVRIGRVDEDLPEHGLRIGAVDRDDREVARTREVRREQIAQRPDLGGGDGAGILAREVEEGVEEDEVRAELHLDPLLANPNHHLAVRAVLGMAFGEGEGRQQEDGEPV